MSRAIWILFCFVSMTITCFAQELLINGNFDDGLAGWTHNPIMDGGVEGTIEILDDEFGPTMGSGPYSYWFCEGSTYFNQCIWQPVTVNVGDTIRVDGAFIDLTGGQLSNYWCELYVGLEEPVENVDYGSNMLLAFNWWDGCGNNIDGTFQNDACVDNTVDGLWVVPDSLGDGEHTVYFMCKMGIWTDGSAGVLFYDIGIDSLSMIKLNGTSDVKSKHTTRPQKFTMLSNYPNPFNPSTTIQFKMPTPADVDVSVYDVRGHLVRTLMNENISAGTHTLKWHGVDNNGNLMPSGVYLCRLVSEYGTQTQRMLLMK